jgi:hypothetical protein
MLILKHDREESTMTNLKLCLEDCSHFKNVDDIIARYFPGLKSEEDGCAQASTIDEPVFSLDRLGFRGGFNKWYQEEKPNSKFWRNYVKEYISKDIEISFGGYLKKLIKKVVKDDNDHFYEGLFLDTFDNVEFLLNHLKRHPKYTAFLEVYIKYFIARRETDEKRLRIETMKILNFRLRKVEIEIIALLRFYRLVALYQMEIDLQKRFDYSMYLQLEEDVREIFDSNNFGEYKLNFGAKDHLRYVNSLKKFESRFVKSLISIWMESYFIPSKFQIEVNASFLNVKAVIVLNIISDLPFAFQKNARVLLKRAFVEFDKKEHSLLATENSGLVRNLMSKKTKETKMSLLYCLSELRFLYKVKYPLVEEDNDGQEVPSKEGEIIKIF